MPVTFHDLEANGLRFHYARWGSDADPKPPLLLAHATGFCGMVWRRTAEQLADRYDVYAFDRRGHGRSSKPEPPAEGLSGYAFDFFAADLVAALDVLELSGVYLAGHSGGASELLIAAARRPDLVSRIVAVEPILAPPDDSPTSTNIMAEQAANRRATFASAAAAIERFGSRPPFDDWEDDVLADYVEHAFAPSPDGGVELRCPPHIEGAMFRSGGEFPIPSILPDVQCPVLIINGGRSGPQFELMAELAVEGLGDAIREVFPQSTHFVPMEAPDALAARIRSFGEDDRGAP